MVFRCPHCGHDIEADDDCCGAVGNCPTCGKAVTVPSSAQNPAIAGKRVIRISKNVHRNIGTGNSVRYRGQESAGNGTLCFWLGFLFGPLGLLISAIIGKGDGVVKALKGLLVWISLCLVAVAAFFLPTMYKISKAEKDLSQRMEDVWVNPDGSIEIMDQGKMKAKKATEDMEKSLKLMNASIDLYDISHGVQLWIQKHGRLPDSYQEVCQSHYLEFDDITERHKSKRFIEPGKQKDAWGRDYMLSFRDVREDENFVDASCIIRSAGPDGVFKSKDDVIKKVSIYELKPSKR